MTRKQQIEVLERAVSDAYRAMAAQEVIWMEEWRAAPNPFVAIKEWNKNSARRMVYIQPWLDAKAELAKFRDKS
jgi:hypothetical protein